MNRKSIVNDLPPVPKPTTEFKPHVPAGDGHLTPSQRRMLENHRSNYAAALKREATYLRSFTTIARLLNLNPETATRDDLIEQIRKHARPRELFVRRISIDMPHPAFLVATGMATGVVLYALGGAIAAGIVFGLYVVLGFILGARR